MYDPVEPFIGNDEKLFEKPPILNEVNEPRFKIEYFQHRNTSMIDHIIFAIVILIRFVFVVQFLSEKKL